MTSRHASDGGRRGIATWIIVTIVVVVLVAAATTAYLLIVGGSDEDAEATCASRVVLPVVAAPGAAAAITDAATAFDATAPIARSACVSSTVTSMTDDEAAAALAADWQQASGTAPGMWVTDTEAALAALETTDSALTSGRDNDPMATSPVVIAVRNGDAAAVTAAGLSWEDLPNATGPNGSVTLPSGRHLVLALPNPSSNRATSYALQSVLAAGSGATVDAAAVTAAAAELATIGAGGSNPQPATTEEALTQLAAGTGGFTAVPVVESDLVAFTATAPGLKGISPSGGTVGDAVHAVPLTAGWIDPTLEDAAALFLAYLRGPGGDEAFTVNGLRIEDASTTGQSEVTPLPAAGPEVDAALAAAIGASPTG